MSDFYERIKATADRLISKYGRPEPAKLIVPTNSGTKYNPTITEVPHDCIIVELEWTNHELETNRIQANDKKVMMAVGSLKVVPTPSHKVEYGGVVHAIVGRDKGMGVKALSPGGTNILYEIHLRG